MTKGKKHMDGTKRCRLQFGLEAGESARTIAKEIGVSLTTVTREIRKHTYESFKGCYGRSNLCVHRQDCRLTQVCNGCPGMKSCHKLKLVYDASRAYGDYRYGVLSAKRGGETPHRGNRPEGQYTPFNGRVASARQESGTDQGTGSAVREERGFAGVGESSHATRDRRQGRAG